MDREWRFIRFGTSSADDLNYTEPNADIHGSVTLNTCTFDENGDVIRKGGKFVADAPADGMSFYYTTINPAEENFYLQSDVRVNYINTAPDGQEGFALMIRDSISGSGNFFSNLTAVGCSTHHTVKEDVKTSVGTRRFTGVVANEDSNANHYNVFRKAFQQENPEKVLAGDLYRVSLEKTSYSYITTLYDMDDAGNTRGILGQHVQYIPARDHRVKTVSNYDELDDPMRVQEPDTAYVALVCARGLNATFSNIIFSTSPWQAESWKPQPDQLIDAVCKITSTNCAPSDDYELSLLANVNGKAEVWVKDALAGTLPLQADKEGSISIALRKSSEICVAFTPDGSGLPPFTKLRSMEKVCVSEYVIRRNLGAEGVVWVSASGKAENDGSSAEKPVDIQTALSFAAPGQTIRLAAETYHLGGRKLIISRGVNGREDAKIILICPDGFATLDFDRTGDGFEAWGNWWHMSRINVRGTRHGKVGMRLGGWHNTLEQMNFFNNGNTGLHLSGLPTETIARWPSYNLILNCNSMNNADDGYEDADGFAAKVTNGVGNVFDGCLSAYNADDGWDMFAKAGTGSIGAVLMKNCVTFRSGYIMGKSTSTKAKVDHAEILVDEHGNLSFADWGGKDCVLTVAGNGNGFKMGGTNLPGAHVLDNCISYENLARGIESNSGTDVKIYRSTSYNNGDQNVALFTENRSAVTDYDAKGILSFRTEEGVGERLRPQGQDTDLRGPSNYYWDEATGTSHNDGDNPVTVDSSWFVSLDTSVLPTRDESGKLNMHGLLLLKEEARQYGAGAQGTAWGQTE